MSTTTTINIIALIIIVGFMLFLKYLDYSTKEDKKKESFKGTKSRRINNSELSSDLIKSKENQNETEKNVLNNNINIGKNRMPFVEYIKEEQLSYTDLVSNAYSSCSIGELNKAIEYANQAILLNPEEHEGYGIKGIAHLQLNDKQKAIQNFNKVIELLQKFQTIVLHCKDDIDVVKIKEFNIRNFLVDRENHNSIPTFRRVALNNIHNELTHFKNLLTPLIK